MKTAIVALAATLFLSGIAFAGEKAARELPPTVDTITTGTIPGASHEMNAPADAKFGSKLGGDIDPSVLPNF